eukprot:CAMPEP_0176320696 /NCGR_PEP_ID=MMETSP0121_2-20121125/70957_1 /TAXON_ID=160619 /ORGANISM="Kryptoperidinium foliaceum, Strain CCMP 1326" /LENGTH=72 /DNA_ID=CAMNT_0017663097 /DNA_START=27 /DNA_END=241 /DNA_ORIENTATION=+
MSEQDRGEGGESLSLLESKNLVTTLPGSRNTVSAERIRAGTHLNVPTAFAVQPTEVDIRVPEDYHDGMPLPV